MPMPMPPSIVDIHSAGPAPLLQLLPPPGAVVPLWLANVMFVVDEEVSPTFKGFVPPAPEDDGDLLFTD